MASLLDRIKSIFFVPADAPAPVAAPSRNLENPSTVLSSEYLDSLGVSKSGSKVDAETVLSITPFWRAIQIISGVVASLPFDVYRVEEDSSTKIKHQITKLISRAPSDVHTKFDFMQTLILHLYTYGNFFARIDRQERLGFPVRLVILSPDRMKIETNTRGGTVYVYTNENGTESRMLADRVLHVSGLSWNALEGISIIETFKQVLATGLDNQKYIASFYANGASLSGVVSVPQKLDSTAYERLRTSWNKSYSGANKAGATAILEQGATYQKVGISPVEAGANEAKKGVVSDIARITGVPQFLLEDLDRATFNNIEELGQLFVTYTILPLCRNIESEFSRKLLSEKEQENHELRLDLSSLLRADTEGRSRLIESLMKWGIINRDEARKIEGINPIADGSGKVYYVPMNMVDPTKAETQNQQDNEQE